MELWLAEHLTLLIAILIVLVVVLELVRPRVQVEQESLKRLISNLGLGMINQWGIRVILPFSLLEVQQAYASLSWAVLPQLSPPWMIELIAGVLFLDALAYAIHRLFHRVPLLWRLHKVHHADHKIDFTTELRHHPLEYLSQWGLVLPVMALMGFDPLVILVHAILAQAISLFAHCNVRLPHGLSSWLDKVLVTPDFHYVHHSSRQVETDSNYGIIFPWWDRILGTETRMHSGQREQIVVGLEQYKDPRYDAIQRVLWMPFDRRSANSRD